MGRSRHTHSECTTATEYLKARGPLSFYYVVCLIASTELCILRLNALAAKYAGKASFSPEDRGFAVLPLLEGPAGARRGWGLFQTATRRGWWCWTDTDSHRLRRKGSFETLPWISSTLLSCSNNKTAPWTTMPVLSMTMRCC